MRPHPFVLLVVLSAAIAACDASTSPLIAGVGTTQPTAGSASQLIVTPSNASVAVGGSVQFTTNAPSTLQSQLVWSTSAPTVASVSPSGLVTGVAAGSATIEARYSFDTTNNAIGVVQVVAPAIAAPALAKAP